MIAPTREDLQLYVMGSYDGDVAALEAQLATDPAAAAMLAEEASFEVLLRDAAAAAVFCPACDDVVAGDRCDTCGAAVRAGGYAIERVLVQNAHGRMYLGRDVDGKQVALKELAFVQSPGRDAHAAFEREALFLRALDHAAIPRFVASFEEGKGVHTRYYLAQELVTGQALDARLTEHWYDEREIIDIARQVLVVLVYLQNLSPMIIHRDIKPANLLRRADGAIALVDFGAAYDQGATVGSTSIGTFGYMPLEQMAGQVDATTDPYALGASLLQLLTRREPWTLMQDPAWPTINASEPLRRFLQRLTAPERADRYPTAKAALEALESVSRGEVPQPERPGTKNRGRGRPRLVRPLLAAAALSAAGLGVAAFFWNSDASDPAPQPALTIDVASGVAGAPEITVPPTVSSALAKADPLPAGKPIDLEFREAASGDVFRFLGAACGVNVVVPDSIRFSTTVTLKAVPCDQALEVLLESRGLWYRYGKSGNLLRIGARRDIDMEDLAARERSRVRADLGIGDDALPEGKPVDLDLKDAPIRDVLGVLAEAGGVNIVLDDSIHGSVTVFAKAVPWADAVRVVLQSEALWYRYRENGKVLRVAPRRNLDMEDLAARERLHRDEQNDPK